MKLRFTILILIITGPNLFGQPGWAWKVQGNLNEIDSTTLKQCLKDGDLCYFGSIEIDSTTDLTRLNHISFLESVSLIMNLEAIPNEFKNVKFPNLKHLRISCGNNLTDIHNLEYLDNLEELFIGVFNGIEVNIDFSKLKKLRSFQMYKAPNVIEIHNVLAAGSLQGIKLEVLPALKFLTTDSLENHENITSITLIDCPVFQIENLKYFQGLKHLGINGSSFISIPNYLSKNLTVLSIGKNDSLSDIKNISCYKNLKEYNLKDNPLIKDKHKKRRN